MPPTRESWFGVLLGKADDAPSLCLSWWTSFHLARRDPGKGRGAAWRRRRRCRGQLCGCLNRCVHTEQILPQSPWELIWSRLAHLLSALLGTSNPLLQSTRCPSAEPAQPPSPCPVCGTCSNADVSHARLAEGMSGALGQQRGSAALFSFLCPVLQACHIPSRTALFLWAGPGAVVRAASLAGGAGLSLKRGLWHSRILHMLKMLWYQARDHIPCHGLLAWRGSRGDRTLGLLF